MRDAWTTKAWTIDERLGHGSEKATHTEASAMLRLKQDKAWVSEEGGNKTCLPLQHTTRMAFPYTTSHARPPTDYDYKVRHVTTRQARPGHD